MDPELARPGVAIQPCTRAQALGLCRLNLATFPPDGATQRWAWRKLPGDWLALQRRLRLNHVLVAVSSEGSVVGSVEVHTPEYMQRKSKGAYTAEQLAQLKPYLASLAVRKELRGQVPKQLTFFIFNFF